MALTAEQIDKEARALSGEARARVAERLVESLDSAPMGRIDEMWAEEAKRRLDDICSGKVQTMPEPEGLALVRRKLGR
jgi:putative addiction module component (TIGR02574 family)